MGRPPLAVGTHGTIRFVKLAKGYRAKARYRGYDGVVRDLSRSGASKTKAERELKSAIASELQTPTGGDITGRSRFREVAERWLAWQERRVADGERATGTLDNYRSMLNNHVLSAFGELRVSEVTVPRLDRFFPVVRQKASAAHARTARAVVGGVLRYAVRHGALTTNPIREIEPIEGGSRKKARALSPDERRSWLAQLELDPRAVGKDLPDLTRFLMATGVRIGEALALYWEDVDLDAGTVAIAWTVVRVRGEGLRRTDPKSESGERLLALPTWAVDMLRLRWKTAQAENRAPDSPVFPDTYGGLRDPSNTRRALREARGSEGFAWVTSHVFRKTAATIMDEAGLSARVIADQLGHARPSLTQDVYMGRGAVSTDAATALENVL
ncbi:tyrosine-type recombinase/integrase [Amycolatopsis cihanbeyliensis]|uniref:Site-specific recombinase XerD n=1 Tax=Amycolatopsis cihanbeyliensis TaxID=1128664 RepID=A0A542DQQ3_AMYCI|nr:site-specific integrase [Amycolatopsis cihanbeyliensis]TQJ05441.1 site-specific recombinase XerD [Amycolatopsis cihanbeyliensis]